MHFGLGSAKRVDVIEIDWPSGLKQMLETTALNRDGLDRIVTVQEGQRIVSGAETHAAGAPKH